MKPQWPPLGLSHQRAGVYHFAWKVLFKVGLTCCSHQALPRYHSLSEDAFDVQNLGLEFMAS